MTKIPPRQLDRFPSTYERAFQAVRANGSLYIKFSSVREADSIKFDLYRFAKSVLTYSNDDDLKDVARLLKIKKDGRSLELCMKDKEEGVSKLEEALVARQTKSVEDESRKEADLDDALADLRKTLAEGVTPGKQS